MLRWALIFLIIALGGAFWTHGCCCRYGRDCEILVLRVPGDLPDLLCYAHIDRQKNFKGESQA